MLKLIKIYGIKFKIMDINNIEENNLSGRVYCEHEIIKINSNLNYKDKLSTLIHEIIHIINYYNNLNLDESYTSILEVGLFDLIINNKILNTNIISNLLLYNREYKIIMVDKNEIEGNATLKNCNIKILSNLGLKSKWYCLLKVIFNIIRYNNNIELDSNTIDSLSLGFLSFVLENKKKLKKILKLINN